MSLIRDYQRQYSSCLHFLYNRISDNQSITEKELRLLYNNVNNCSLINKWIFQCAIKEAKHIYKLHGAKVIFGGKANYFKRNNLAITKEEYKAKRISSIYSIGESNYKGNRFFRLKEDNVLTFQPNRLCHIYRLIHLSYIIPISIKFRCFIFCTYKMFCIFIVWNTISTI